MRSETMTMNQFMTDMRRDLEDRLQDYDSMKGQLMAEVISAKDNAELLKQMPHRQMKDMAVIYRFMMGESPYGEPMTVAVTNAMLESYGITEAQLHDDTMAAMKMNQPYSIRPLGAVLAETDPFMDPEMGEVMGPPGLYVATTESKMYGAAVIAQPDFMDNAAGVLKELEESITQKAEAKKAEEEAKAAEEAAKAAAEAEALNPPDPTPEPEKTVTIGGYEYSQKIVGGIIAGIAAIIIALIAFFALGKKQKAKKNRPDPDADYDDEYGEEIDIPDGEPEDEDYEE